MLRGRDLLVRVAVSALAAAAVGAALAPSAGASSRRLHFQRTVLKRAGGEPNVSVSPTGKFVLVDGLDGTSPATLYRSRNYGRTFKRLHPTWGGGTGGGDWDMRFLGKRTVIAADLSIGSGIYIHRSTDAGKHWSTISLGNDQYDRPWIDHFGRKHVYVVAKGFDNIPYLFRSTDGGKSFGTPPIPLIVYGIPGQGGPDPGGAFGSNWNAYVDHLTVDPHTGDVYVLYGIDDANTYSDTQPLGAANHMYIAHLEQGRMISHEVYVGGPRASFLAGFNWLTVDRNGTLYALLNGRIGRRWSTRLAYSRDKGRTWSPLTDVGKPRRSSVYGSIAAGKPGVLSLIYLRGSKRNPSKSQRWYAEMARVSRADSPRPKLIRDRPIRKPMHLKDICFDGIVCGAPGFGTDRNLLDYIWNAVGPDGRAYGVFSSDGPATHSRNSRTPDVVVLRQKGGPRHGHGSPS